MNRPQPRSTPAVLLALAAIASLAIAACGSSTPTAAPTVAPTVAATPTAAPTTAPAASTGSSDPFSGLPFTLTLPPGWNGFNLQDPAAQASIDQFAAANPNLAASIQAFKAIPGVRMAVNPLLGNILLVLTTPSNGIALDVIAQSFNAQFQSVPGLQAAPSPEPVTLPGGNAIHWQLQLQANKAGGGTVQVTESIYLLANSSNAVILEFVVPQGGAIPDEQAIVNSFKFTTP